MFLCLFSCVYTKHVGASVIERRIDYKAERRGDLCTHTQTHKTHRRTRANTGAELDQIWVVPLTGWPPEPDTKVSPRHPLISPVLCCDRQACKGLIKPGRTCESGSSPESPLLRGKRIVQKKKKEKCQVFSASCWQTACITHVHRHTHVSKILTVRAYA